MIIFLKITCYGLSIITLTLLLGARPWRRAIATLQGYETLSYWRSSWWA